MSATRPYREVAAESPRKLTKAAAECAGCGGAANTAIRRPPEQWGRTRQIGAPDLQRPPPRTVIRPAAPICSSHGPFARGVSFTSIVSSGEGYEQVGRRAFQIAGDSLS